VRQDRSATARTGPALALLEPSVEHLPRRQAVRAVMILDRVALSLRCMGPRLEGWITGSAALAAKAGAGKTTEKSLGRNGGTAPLVAPRAPDVHLEAMA
jgi:hypothetical protein